jgi:hypothetical protein
MLNLGHIRKGSVNLGNFKLEWVRVGRVGLY